VAIVLESLLALDLPEVEQTYTVKDAIIYALGCGLGLDPTDERQLPFVRERDIQALPTMVTVLAHPGFWIRDLNTGIDWLKVVHGEQGIHLHRPLPPQGTVVARHRITHVIDKGEGRGAVVLWARDLYDKSSGDHLATVEQASFCRGDGGFGGPSSPQAALRAMPDRPSDATCILGTSPQAALIYRLSGDLNPIHVDPQAARAAGFERPILHGLATFGVAGHALFRCEAPHENRHLTGMKARFTAPVYPGETLRTDMWQETDGVSFRVTAMERGTVVIDNGLATFASPLFTPYILTSRFFTTGCRD
jgi:acyl dehydratase